MKYKGVRYKVYVLTSLFIECSLSMECLVCVLQVMKVID